LSLGAEHLTMEAIRIAAKVSPTHSKNLRLCD
jgi:hypothetical protein